MGANVVNQFFPNPTDITAVDNSIMAQMIIKCISDCLYGTGDWDPHNAIPAAPPAPDVTLDSTAMGRGLQIYIF